MAPIRSLFLTAALLGVSVGAQNNLTNVTTGGSGGNGTNPNVTTITLCTILDETPGPYFDYDQITKEALGVYKEWANNNTDGRPNFLIGNMTFNVDFTSVDGGTACAGNEVQPSNLTRYLKNLQSAIDQLEFRGNCTAYLVPFLSARTKNILPIVNTTGRPVITLGAMDESIYNKQNYPLVWSTLPGLANRVRPLLDALAAKGATRLAYIHTDEASSKSFVTSIQRYLEGGNTPYTIVYNRSYVRARNAAGEMMPDASSVKSIIREMQNTIGMSGMDVFLYAGAAVDLDGMWPVFEAERFAPPIFYSVGDLRISSINIPKSFEGFLSNVLWTPEVSLGPISNSHMGNTSTWRSIADPYVRMPLFKEGISGPSMAGPLVLQMAMEGAGCSNLTRTVYADCVARGMARLDANTWFGTVRFNQRNMNTAPTYIFRHEAGNTVRVIRPQDVPISSGFRGREQDTPAYALSMTSAALCLAGIALCIGGFLFVYICRAQLVIRTAAPCFLLLMLFGAGVDYVSVVLIALSPNLSTWVCTSYVWTSDLGWAIAFLALLVKTYRIQQVFRPMVQTNLDDARLIARLYAPILAIFLVYLTVYTVFAPPGVVTVSTDSVIFNKCNVDRTTFSYIGTAMRLVLLAWAAFLAFQVRNTPSAFNEAPMIAATVYNWTMIEVLLAILIFFVVETASTQLAFVFVRTFVPLTAMLLMLFTPKLMAVFRGHGDTLDPRGTSQPTAMTRRDSIHSMGSQADETERMMCHLQGEVRRLQQENAKLHEAMATLANRHIKDKPSIHDCPRMVMGNSTISIPAITDRSAVAAPLATIHRITRASSMDGVVIGGGPGSRAASTDCLTNQMINSTDVLNALMDDDEDHDTIKPMSV